MFAGVGMRTEVEATNGQMSSTQATIPTPSSPAIAWLTEHGDALYRYALLRVRRTDIAEDLVQETLLAAIRAHDRFTEKSSQRTWLIGILKHKIVDHLRKLWRERKTTGAFDPNGVADPFTENGNWKRRVVDWRAGPVEEIQSRELGRVLQDCLRKLPPRVAELFWLREAEDVPTDELCQLLDVSPTNVWSMLYRARIRLRECLSLNWFGKQERS
jgi:RNA polymerase sigma-70 factor (ECF subfamily)